MIAGDRQQEGQRGSKTLQQKVTGGETSSKTTQREAHQTQKGASTVQNAQACKTRADPQEQSGGSPARGHQGHHLLQSYQDGRVRCGQRSQRGQRCVCVFVPMNQSPCDKFLTTLSLS